MAEMTTRTKWRAGHGILYSLQNATHADAELAEAWLAARENVEAELARLNANNGRLVNLAARQDNRISTLEAELAAALALANQYQAAATDPTTDAAKLRDEAVDYLEEMDAIKAENDRLRRAAEAA